MSMFKDRSRFTGCKVCLLAGAVVTAAVVLTLGVAGCGDSGNPASGNNGGGGGGGSSGLVLAPNEAWFECEEYDKWCEGAIFQADGRYIDVIQLEDGTWVGVDDGTTWSVNGDRLIIKERYYDEVCERFEEYEIVMLYNISGDILTLREFWQFTATNVSGIYIESGNIGNPTGIRDDNLILANNMAWTMKSRHSCIIRTGEYYGLIFRSNGSFVEVFGKPGNWWGDVAGTWFTSRNNRLFFNYLWGDTDECNYTVSGNTLTMTSVDEMFATRTSGINLTRIFDSRDDYYCEVYGGCYYYSQSKRPARPSSSTLRRSGLRDRR